MITPAQEKAAQYLFAARTNRQSVARIPVDFRPADMADAIAVQQRVAALVGDRIGGWKCSVPSAARPTALAPIFASTVRTASPCPMIATGETVKVEPEIAFMIDRDLPARGTPYSEADVRGAIRDTRLVLELIGARLADTSTITFPEHLADNISNQGIFIGPVITNPSAKPLEGFPITVSTPAGVMMTRDGKHPDGNPLGPLYWLANYLAERGDPLRAGQIVTTGSYAGVLEVPLDTPLTFTFSDFGTLAVTLTRAQ
jgi:2-keto-4-pentenoate hydratase